MTTAARVSIVAMLVFAVAVTVALRRDGRAPGVGGRTPAAAALPRLLEVGSDRCIPCRAMAPILDELRREYDGQLRVDFIDAWKEPDKAAPYNVYAIPAQIFFDPAGREVHRHLGFISKADIVETWRTLGFRLTPGRG